MKKMNKRINHLIAAACGWVAIMVANSASAWGHSGRTDKYGCHADSSTGTRHCHGDKAKVSDKDSSKAKDKVSRKTKGKVKVPK